MSIIKNDFFWPLLPKFSRGQTEQANHSPFAVPVRSPAFRQKTSQFTDDEGSQSDCRLSRRRKEYANCELTSRRALAPVAPLGAAWIASDARAHDIWPSSLFTSQTPSISENQSSLVNKL